MLKLFISSQKKKQLQKKNVIWFLCFMFLFDVFFYINFEKLKRIILSIHDFSNGNIPLKGNFAKKNIFLYVFPDV